MRWQGNPSATRRWRRSPIPVAGIADRLFATINWGDGTTSLANITGGPAGGKADVLFLTDTTGAWEATSTTSKRPSAAF